VSERVPSSTRRREIIAHAADLLREGGPDALTSVAVAHRTGISQSAVYRHVRNMEELAGLASAEVVGGLHRVFTEILRAPELEFHDRDDLSRLITSILDAMASHALAFEVVDRWRFADGVLGEGIRGVVAEGREMVALVLEHQWRVVYGYTGELTDADRLAQRSHAALLHDDAHSVARIVRGPALPGGTATVTRITEIRVLMAWHAYVADMQRRTGGPAPEIAVR
jgi:AcrR family transcriptional regulator